MQHSNVICYLKLHIVYFLLAGIEAFAVSRISGRKKKSKTNKLVSNLKVKVYLQLGSFFLALRIVIQPVGPLLAWHSNNTHKRIRFMKKVRAHCGVNVQIGNCPARIFYFVAMVCVNWTKKKNLNLENESFENSHTYIKINYIDENPDRRGNEAWCYETRTEAITASVQQI